MENQSVVVNGNVRPTHQSEDAEKRGRGVPGSARRGSPGRSPEPPQSFWNVSTEKKLDILKVNLEQHGRIVDEQIRSLRQEFVPQKSVLSDLAALQDEVRQLRAPDVPPLSNLEIQINSLQDALQELSLTVQDLKDERESYRSTNKSDMFMDQHPTTIAMCDEVEVIGTVRPHGSECETWRVSARSIAEEEDWVDHHVYYHFSTSVWIASFWVGIAPFAESVCVIIMLFLNGLLQSYFCVLIGMNMGVRSNMHIEDDDLEGLLSWRTSSAHDFKNYDATTNTSLAARACGGWSALTLSSDQTRIHESFDTYIGDHGILWGGTALCMICLVCWFFLVAVDVMDNLHCSVAVLVHWKKGRPTEVTEDNKSFKFRQISTSRVVLIQMVAVVPRFAIACTLFYQGARFLIYTLDPIELILNAIALGFILELDELTFDFLPETVRTAILRTNSLNISDTNKSRWMYLRPFFILLVALASFVGAWELIDVVDRMSVAQEILCGGDTDFVFAVDGALGVVRTAKTRALHGPDMDSYRFFAVLQDVHLDVGLLEEHPELSWIADSAMGETHLSIDQTLSSIDEISKASDSQALGAVPCADHDTDAYLVRLRETRDDEFLMSCSDLALHCEEAEVRMFCASTCKCDTQTSGMYRRAGCSSSCDSPVLDELSEMTDRMYGVGSGSSSCTSDVEGWQDRFVEELWLVLVSAGQLERKGAAEYVWSASFVHEVNKIGVGRFYVSSEGLDLNTWLDTSAPSNLCDAIPYFDTLMGTSLCDAAASLDGSLGSLEALCPRACGLCDLEGSESRLVFLDLYQKQGEDLSSGLIDFPIFSENITYETLSCGNTTGSTDPEDNVLGNESPEQVYQFYSSVNQTVVFSTCGAAEFDTIIRVLDEYYLEISSNDDFEGCAEYTSYLEVTFETNKLVYVLVEGYDEGENGDYKLTVSC